MPASQRIQQLAAHICANPVPNETAHDLASAYRKYEHERDKRLAQRPSGNLHYNRVTDLAETDGRFAKMLSDPWSTIVSRAPLMDEVEVCVVGAGWGGLLAGARLREVGVEAADIRLIDSAGDVGGTWYWNRYPGAMCDTEAYCYMPLCEELGYVPTEKYAHQPELYAHSRRIAEKFGLYQNACLSTQVTGLEWKEESGRWLVSTNRGDAFFARFIIMNFGLLLEPKLPSVPGVASFSGQMFHTSRWDYEYTGGSSEGGLVGLADKRVAIIGTGATAVQAVPHLGEHSKHLFVFQRTPSSVFVRENRPTTPEFASQCLSTPGWQEERNVNYTTTTMMLSVAVEDMVQDGWGWPHRRLQQKMRTENDFSVQRMGKLVEDSDFEYMEEVRARVSQVVKDEATAAALKPYYRRFCKRPCFHDEYLQTFNRPNVTLVDTDGCGIEEVTCRGVVVNGKEYEVDCIVMATGFDVNREQSLKQKIGYDISGRGGMRLSEKWAAGPRTLNSYNTHGFPNLWIQNAPQGVLTISLPHALDAAATHAAHAITRMKRDGLRTVDPSLSAESAYCEHINSVDQSAFQAFFNSCTPGYYNNEGDTSKPGLFSGQYPGGPLKFFKMLRRMREEARIFEGMDVD